jgi:hypothetical protein
MFAFLDKLSDRGLLWTIKGAEVGVIDGIVLFDVRKRGDAFRPTLESALRLVREHDPRRYAKIVRYLPRIVNAISDRGTLARYIFSIRTLFLEFHEVPALAADTLAAFYACVLARVNQGQPLFRRCPGCRFGLHLLAV